MDHLMAATWTRRQARPDALPVSGTGPGRELAAGTESGERRCDGLASAGASAACHVSGLGASVPAPLRGWLAGPPSQPEASSISCTSTESTKQERAAHLRETANLSFRLFSYARLTSCIRRARRSFARRNRPLSKLLGPAPPVCLHRAPAASPLPARSLAPAASPPAYPNLSRIVASSTPGFVGATLRRRAPLNCTIFRCHLSHLSSSSFLPSESLLTLFQHRPAPYPRPANPLLTLSPATASCSPDLPADRVSRLPGSR